MRFTVHCTRFGVKRSKKNLKLSVLFSIEILSLNLLFAGIQSIANAQSLSSPETTERMETLDSPEICGARNWNQREETIVVGNFSETPYVVVIPGRGDNLLDSVRQCVTDAFQTESNLGPYIRAGAFSEYCSARQLSRYLRSLKLNARVVYFP